MGWPEQKSQLDALNLFYSTVKNDSSRDGLISQGYNLVGRFMPVSDDRHNVAVQPDFTFYEPEAIIFVNVETADTMSEEHRERTENYQRLNLEAVRGFISDKGRADGETLHVDDLQMVDHYMVFPKSTVDKAENGGPGAAVLDHIRDQRVGIASQQKGGTLRYRAGVVQAENFHGILDQGVSLPDSPNVEHRLPGEIKADCLVVALAQNTLPNEFNQNAVVTMSPQDVRESQRRNIPNGLAQRALEYFAYKDLCDRINEYEYEFDRYDVGDIMNVEEDLRETSVNEFLNQQGGSQSSVEDF